MRLAIGLAAAVVVAAGCEGNISPEPQTADMSSGASAPAPPEPAPPGDPQQAKAARMAEAQAAPASGEEAPPPSPAAPAENGAAAPGAPAPADDAADPSNPNDEPQGATEVAKVGVGAKGRDYGGAGIITTPIQQYFRARDRIEFDIKLANAMKLYKAGNNNKGPESHEEFMDVIIKDNAVQLPELPMGDEYFYDAKSEQLLVKHPAK